MADNNDVFSMVVEDKLDGTNYPLWAYMMCHVLVARGLCGKLMYVLLWLEPLECTF